AKLAFPISMERHWRWRWLDTFDWYTPKYQFKYLYPEIFRWYQRSGFHELEIFGDPIRMSGQKRPMTEMKDGGQQRWRDLVASGSRDGAGVPGCWGQVARLRRARALHRRVAAVTPDVLPGTEDRPHRAARGGPGDRGTHDGRDGATGADHAVRSRDDDYVRP